MLTLFPFFLSQIFSNPAHHPQNRADMKSMKRKPWVVLTFVAALCLSLFSPANAQLVGDDAGAQDTLVLDSPESARQNTSYAWQGFPLTAKTPEETFILVSKEVPKEVRPGVEYSYKIMVTNNAAFQIDNVVLTERLPSNFEFAKSSPEAEVRGNFLRFEFQALAPRQVEVITISGSTPGPGMVSHLNDTDLKFAIGPLTNITSVVQPQLGLIAETPETAILRDPIPMKLTFRNAGSAPVYDARLAQVLPNGLLTDQSADRFELNVGTLYPGDIKVFDMALRSTAVGDYQLDLLATARDGVTASAMVELSVVKPELTISSNVPAMRFVGNNISSEISVQNVGDGQARNTVITQYLAADTGFVNANEGGVLQNNTVVWNVGTLNPGETKTVTSRVSTKSIMTVRTSAIAEAHQADSVETVMITDVQGVSALKVNMGDINDPVPVGDNEVYFIRVTNQGSLNATGVRLKAILEDAMEFVSSTGPSEPTVEGNTVVFARVPTLAPNAVAEWRVVIKARKAGDVRFTAVIDSDQLTEAVESTESTNFYN